jgi:uracil-DNA glycosylase family 4
VVAPEGHGRIQAVAGGGDLGGRPKVVVALGATAAQALFGREFKVSRQRGELVESALAPLATATVHPSSILRAPDEDTRKKAMNGFVADPEGIAKELN